MRLISWGAMMGGVLLLRSGEILIGLLAFYLALFNVAQRKGMDIVREETGSAGAAALFVAVLLAVCFLVLFPLPSRPHTVGPVTNESHAGVAHAAADSEGADGRRA